MKLKFGYDLSDLTAYVNEEKLPLLMASVFSGETTNTFEWQQGIKYKEVLNYLDLDVYMRADTGCSTFTASGDTRLTQKEISVDGVIHETSHCPADLEDYWARIGMQAGSYQDRLPFEQEWTAYYAEKVKKEVELQLWKGNKGTGTGNLALINGFLQVIDADTTVIDGNLTGGGWTQIASGTGITAGNVISIIEHMVDMLPVDVEGADDLIICVGWDTFRKALSAYRTLNNFFIDGANTSPYNSGELFIPTWGIKMKAFRGLTATNRIVLARVSNFVIGTDLQNDYENYQLWYEQKDDKIYTRLKYKLGTQIKFGSEMVEFTLK
jgi:hypothetical protein